MLSNLRLALVGGPQWGSVTSNLRHLALWPSKLGSLRQVPFRPFLQLSRATGKEHKTSILFSTFKFVGAVQCSGCAFLLLRRASCNWTQKTASARAGNRLVPSKLATTPQLSWADIWKLIIPHVHLLVLAIMGAVVVALLNVQIPILLGRMVNEIAELLKLYGGAECSDRTLAISTTFARFNSTALHLLALYSGQAVSTLLYISCLSWLGERMAGSLRVRLFQHLLHFDMAFFDRQRVGELNDRLNSDVQEFKSSFKTCVAQGLRTCTQTAGCVGSLYMISPTMTLVTAAVVPLVIGIGTAFGALLRRVSVAAQQQGAFAAGVADEAFQNIRTVKAFAMEEAETELYRREVERGRRLNELLGAGIGAFQAASNLFLNGIVLGVLYAGGKMMFPSMVPQPTVTAGSPLVGMTTKNGEGAISPGDLMAFLVTAQTIQRSLAQLSLVFGSALRGWTAGARIHEFLQLQPNNTGGTKHIPHHSLEGNLRLHDVSFTYPTRVDHPVLTHLDLDIKAGSKVALCGPSGSGKSTIAALLQRLYLPQGGTVTLDGVDLRELDPQWLRSKVIGVIAQEPSLFATSIEENIRYGRSDASDAEVREVAKLANAHEFIERFPHGYATVVGERGVTLSGGQKQRIAIARALLKNPPVLILDEATSALDASSERAVQEALERAMRGRTVIVIAHRLSTIQNADAICVVEDGCLVERGTHHELLKKKGAYHNLVRLQQHHAHPVGVAAGIGA